MAEKEGKERGKKLLGLLFAVFRGATRLFVKSNPKQQKDNQHQSCQNLYISADCPKITHFSNFSSNFTVKAKNNIPKRKLNVKAISSSGFLGRERVEPRKAKPKLAAEKLIDNPDSARSHGFDISINFNLTKGYLFVN